MFFLLPRGSTFHLQAPESLLPHKRVEVASVTVPSQGASYNPPAIAYNDLVRTAVEIEQKREAEAQRFASATVPRTGSADEGVDMTGMLLDVPSGRQQDEDGPELVTIAPRLPKRKTAQQRRNAAKLRAQVSSNHVFHAVIILTSQETCFSRACCSETSFVAG